MPKEQERKSTFSHLNYWNGKRVRTLDMHEEDVRTIWFALRAYKEKLEHDLSTKMDGDVRFGVEDEAFLHLTLGNVSSILFRMQDSGLAEHLDVS